MARPSLEGTIGNATAGTTRSRAAIVGAIAIGMAVAWNLANVGAAADSVADHYGIAVAAVGLFTSALFFSQVLFQLPGGWAIDRWGPRPVGAVMLVLVAGGNALTLAGGGLVFALGMRFVVGFGVGTGFVAGATLVRDAQGATLAQGLYGGLALMMGGVAVAIVAALEPSLGWQAPFITAVVVSVVALAVVAFTPAPPHDPERSRTPARTLFSNTLLRRFAAVHAATFGLSVVLANWVVTLLTRHGYTEGAAGAIGSLILVGGIVGRPLGGLLALRLPGRTRTMVTVAMIMGAVGCLLLAATNPPLVAVAGAALVGLAAGLPFGPTIMGAARVFQESPGAALGAISAPATAAIMVATPLLGLTFLLPSDGSIGYVAAGALWAIAVFAIPAESDLSAY